jgi:hypothetical protein
VFLVRDFVDLLCSFQETPHAFRTYAGGDARAPVPQSEIALLSTEVASSAISNL